MKDEQLYLVLDDTINDEYCYHIEDIDCELTDEEKEYILKIKENIKEKQKERLPLGRRSFCHKYKLRKGRQNKSDLLAGICLGSALDYSESASAKLCLNSILKGDKSILVENCPYSKGYESNLKYC